MLSTSNPALSRLPRGGYAGFNQPSGGRGSASGPPQRGQGGAPGMVTGDETRPMTIDDVIIKTAIMLGLTVVTGLVTMATGLYVLALPAALIGLVIAMVIIFKKKVSPPLCVAYAAVEGVFVGGVTALFMSRFGSGIVIGAVGGTVGVFAGMLVIYRTGAIKVTPRFTKWLLGAMVGVLVAMLANFVAYAFFDVNLGLRDGGPLAIGFSLLVIGVAAFSLLMDFDAADRAIREGVDSKWAWYIAFGLLVTLVWLYLEILRLLSYLRE